jgi:hypothetical protein
VGKEVVVLVGSLVLVAVAGSAVADYTRKEAQLDKEVRDRAEAERLNAVIVAERCGGVTKSSSPEAVARHSQCVVEAQAFTEPFLYGSRTQDSWEDRRVWYALALTTAVVLTAATAFVVPRYGRHSDG